MIEILHPGFLASVQDSGRYGYRRFGVPISGAMDKFALRVANLLVGNAENKAGIEVTLGYGFRLKFHRDVRVAVTGGDLPPKVNNDPVPMWRGLGLKKNEILTFGSPRAGFRAYIGIDGGIGAPFLMNSYSPMVGVSGGNLNSGDRLRIGQKQGLAEIQPRPLPAHFIPEYKNKLELRVTLGPQDDFFPPESLERFLNSDYTITPQSNRQGFRLEGPVLKHLRTHDIISEPVWPGSIQVPGDGLPVILCVDAQTTGGYPKIASVISAEVDKLGQARPSDKISFKRVSIEEAHRLYLEKERRIKTIKRILWETVDEGMGI